MATSDTSSGDVRRGIGPRRRWATVVGTVVTLAAVVTAATVLRGGDDDVAGEPAAAEADADIDLVEVADAERAEEERLAEARADEERRAAEEAEAAAAREAEAAADAARRAEEERLAEERRAEEAAREAQREAEREAEAKRQALVAAQERLIELGYLLGAADGELGQQTASALMAFQAVQGISVDGALGPQTTAALESPTEPSLRGGPANRIEVDMDRQILHLVEGDRRVTTMKVSTGRGGTFESQDGQTLRAETPVGTFTIDRRIAGEKPSSYGIGSMWDPMYFHGPWAIHGSPNVPVGPASSGCVRIAMANGRWLFERVPNGTKVVLYGGTHVFTP